VSVVGLDFGQDHGSLCCVPIRGTLFGSHDAVLPT
jgi:hypothetical protein